MVHGSRSVSGGEFREGGGRAGVRRVKWSEASRCMVDVCWRVGRGCVVGYAFRGCGVGPNGLHHEFRLHCFPNLPLRFFFSHGVV